MTTITGTSGNDNNLQGTSGDDTIYGLAGDDALYGGDGNDILFGDDGADYLDGGAGTDIATYWSSTSGINLNIAGDGSFSNTGHAVGDTVTASIEEVGGSNYADHIRDDGSNRTLHGFGGDDTLEGMAGTDNLYGDDGNDTLAGGNDADNLYGGNGDDTLFGGAGGDTLDGGAGFDILSYWESSSGIVFDLNTPANNTGIASGDTITSVERIDGSNYNDTIYDNSTARTLYGWGGNDTLGAGGGNDSVSGNDGDDTLYGDAGDDLLYGGAGDDDLYGGSGADTLFGDGGADYFDGGADYDIVTYWSASGGVTVAMDSSLTWTGDAAGDSILGSSVERIDGSNYDDVIRDDGGGRTLHGWAGDDSIRGNGCVDIIYGDDGDDTITRGDGEDTLYGGAGADLMEGNGGNDTIYAGDGSTSDVTSLYGGTGIDTRYGGSGKDAFLTNIGDIPAGQTEVIYDLVVNHVGSQLDYFAGNAHMTTDARHYNAQGDMDWARYEMNYGTDGFLEVYFVHSYS